MSKSVLITGATRGLGRGLAREFAARGYNIALTGRSIDDLSVLASELHPAKVCIKQLDVQDFGTIPLILQQCAEELGGLDIVIANAGVAFTTPVATDKFEQICATIDINLKGAIATAEAAVALFRAQGHGQFVGISSIAALRGMPRQSAYCASKVGFSTYLESLRCETWDEPITVTDLAPGYIDTDLNRSVANRPFVISAEKGTRIMADLIERKVGFRYVPSWPWSLIAPILKLLPQSLLRKI
jgi:NAD(P)-dependent dehydrogenase (short-subunit alcohol dehydrogenase family)